MWLPWKRHKRRQDCNQPSAFNDQPGTSVAIRTDEYPRDAEDPFTERLARSVYHSRGPNRPLEPRWFTRGARLGFEKELK